MIKKIIVIVLLLTLTGCRVSEETIPDDIPNTKAPNFYGVEDIEITKFTRFNPLDGVSSYDVQDGFLTDSIVVEGRVDASESGIYLIKYRVTDSDNNQTLYLRYITVEIDVSEAVSIFPYGEFYNGLEGFGVYQEEGIGHGTFIVRDGVLEIQIQSVEQGIWFRPRLNTDGVRFEEGSLYRIQFDAKADENRIIQLQVGELLTYDPWFLKFDQDVNLFTIESTWTTYSYEFTMYNDTNDNGSILFEFGDVAGDRLLTTIYLDHIKILKLN